MTTSIALIHPIPMYLKATIATITCIGVEVNSSDVDALPNIDLNNHNIGTCTCVSDRERTADAYSL
jgi:hypothetical protein